MSERLFFWPWSTAGLPSPMIFFSTDLLVCNPAFSLKAREGSAGKEGNKALVGQVNFSIKGGSGSLEGTRAGHV